MQSAAHAVGHTDAGCPTVRWNAQHRSLVFVVAQRHLRVRFKSVLRLADEGRKVESLPNWGELRFGEQAEGTWVCTAAHVELVLICGVKWRYNALTIRFGVTDIHRNATRGIQKPIHRICYRFNIFLDSGNMLLQYMRLSPGTCCRTLTSYKHLKKSTENNGRAPRKRTPFKITAA